MYSLSLILLPSSKCTLSVPCIIFDHLIDTARQLATKYIKLENSNRKSITQMMPTYSIENDAFIFFFILVDVEVNEGIL